VDRALAAQTRSEPLAPRLLERGDTIPIVLSPWSLDAMRGNCTTLVLLAHPATQFVVNLHPWPGTPSALASSAGALELTRCGRERASLASVLVEMRSPRALLLGRLAVGQRAPEPLTQILPQRDPGPAAPPGDPGPMPPRETLQARMQHFEQTALGLGAASVEHLTLPAPSGAPLTLEPGCHRLLLGAEAPTEPAALVLDDAQSGERLRLEPEDGAEVRHEICTLRRRSLRAVLDPAPQRGARTLSVAHHALPVGLPERFGPVTAEQLLRALGGSRAPKRLGKLVLARIGAQGRTVVPQELVPKSCYLAAAVATHGSAQSLSIGARAGALSAESNQMGSRSGAPLAFCTAESGAAEIAVEARGSGLSWLLLLFRLGPAQPEEP